MQINKKLLQQAAMFGLDARIALAIFGALSIIAGAALYKSVKHAKAVSLLTEMQEVGKAWEAYYLDTGLDLPTVATDLNDRDYYVSKTNRLVKNIDSVSNWKGPYLNYPQSSHYLKHPKYHEIYLLTLTNDNTWGGDVAWDDATNGRCPSGDKCSLWVLFCGFKDDHLALALDSLIDNNDGPKAGDLRWRMSISPYYLGIYLKYAPIKNPND